MERETVLLAQQGRFTLQRWPQRPCERLRAWDAADEYLLNYLAEHPPAPGAQLALYNDGCGALAVALARYRPWLVSDSFIAQQAARHNLQLNGVDPLQVTLLDSLASLPGTVDVALLKAPKTLALLEDQLLRLRPYLSVASRVVVAGMVKGLPAALWGLLAQTLGPVETSLAWKKARLLYVSVDAAVLPRSSPYPTYYCVDGSALELCNHANLFSRERLDGGTRLLLQSLTTRPAVRQMVDLGCGNGVIGLVAAQRNPQAAVDFVDESFMAVASAQANWTHAGHEAVRARFIVGDGLAQYAADSVDWVLCNPPFHHAQQLDDYTAPRLFRQAHRALRPGGELWVIGNRHLGYHLQLQRLFGNAQLLASDPRFVLLRAEKSPAV